MSALPDGGLLEPGGLEPDRGGWMVTFSDVVLQLFAFVIVAVVVESGAPPVEGLLAAVAPRPSSVASTTDTPIPMSWDLPPRRAHARERAPDEQRGEPAAFEVAEAIATPAVAPAPAEEPAIESPPSLQERPAPDARVLALGRYFEELLRAGGIEDATEVRLDGDEVVVSLGETVGFAPASDEIPSAGLAFLAEVHEVARSMPDLAVSVSGHTDDRPIHTARFPSNLHLSLARAAQVVEALTAEDPDLRGRVFASGYGAERPIAANDSEAGRARNRRVEIRLVPAG